MSDDDFRALPAKSGHEEQALIRETGTQLHAPTPQLTDGMTLRDYFAAQALTGVAAGTVLPISPAVLDAIAKNCYALADAMLRARQS